MTKLEMVQFALKTMGLSSHEEVAAFIEKRFGVTVEAKFMPLYKASLLGLALIGPALPATTEPGSAAKR